MASRVAARRVRWGILCLPLAGLVSLESLVAGGESVLPSQDLRGFAEQVTSVRFQFSLLIGNLQTTLLLVGCFALYTYLAGSRAERWALAGLVLFCIQVFVAGIETGLTLSSVPAAKAYLEGQREALNGFLLLDDFTAFPPLIMIWALVGGFLFSILSNLFFGVAIWRSGTLPQGAAILWVGAAALGMASLNPSTYLGASIQALVVALDLGGSGWIAWSIWRRPVGHP